MDIKTTEIRDHRHKFISLSEVKMGIFTVPVYYITILHYGDLCGSAGIHVTSNSAVKSIDVFRRR